MRIVLKNDEVGGGGGGRDGAMNWGQIEKRGLQTKVHEVRATVFPVVVYRCESCTVSKFPRAFLGMSPVPLPSRLPFSPTFLAIYWIWSLHLLRLESSTSSSFSDLDSDPRVL